MKFALFLYDPYEAGGGLNDLEFVGTMDDCVALAEKEDSYRAAHIAEVETLRVVKTGHTKYFPLHEETGLSSDRGKGQYRFVWEAA